MTTTTHGAVEAGRRARGASGARVLGRSRQWWADGAALLLLTAALFLGLALSYRVPTQVDLGVAGRYNVPYLHGFHDPETVAGQSAPSYRWTTERSTISAPGLGRGIWATTLRLSAPQSDRPKPVTVSTADRVWRLPVEARPRDYRLFSSSRGDLSVMIESDVARIGADPRELGVSFAGAQFAPVVVHSFPPTATLLLAGTALLVAFATLRFMGLSPWLAVLGPIVAVPLLAVSAAFNRAPIGLLLPKLAILAVAGLIISALLGIAWRGLVQLGRLEPAPWLLPALLAIFYAGFWIKSVGVLYPYTRVVDVGWHVRDIQSVLNGQWREFYLPSQFSYGKMPVSEWGNRPPLLPYTPFFHIVAASFAIFPWDLATSVNIFAVVFDTNRVLLIAALALAFGLSSRGALLAALLYAITPFTFMLHSWGNTPTTFGLWWTLLAITILVLTWGRWHERRVFALLTAVLLATFLFYFVTAVFSGIFVLLLALAFALWRKRPARQIGALLGSGALALALSIALYYIFFIPEMIGRTLPYITQTVAGGQVNAGQAAAISLADYLRFHYTHMGYLNYPVRHGVWLPVLLTLPGLLLLRRNRAALLIMGTWLVVALLFFVVGLRVSMVDKYIFYAAPAFAICAAAVFERWWRRGIAVQGVIVVLYLLTFVSALDIWIARLQRVA